jgi:hypothetical protein
MYEYGCSIVVFCLFLYPNWEDFGFSVVKNARGTYGSLATEFGLSDWKDHKRILS